MNELIEKDKNSIWHPFTSLQGAPDPILVTSASGIYLHTAEGKKIIDAISSWWVNLHGHSHPKIALAIGEQAKQLEHVIFAGFTHLPAIQLAENLLSILPENQSRIFFSDNGSTAVEVAIKMAIQYWYNKGINRRKIIAIEGAYHGDTFGAMSVAERGAFSQPFDPYLFETFFIEFPEPQKEEVIFEKFKKLIVEENPAAFIYEPLVQGAAGMRMYSEQFLNKLIEYAQQKDVICIADEVFTGFGRTGKLFASDYCETKPDIMALSKGLTGGTMPLGATSASSKIVEAFQSTDLHKTFFHGHSYTANPLACAVANASFSLLMESECQENILRISEKHKQFIQKIKHNLNTKNLRSIGTILAIELKTENESSYFNEVRKKIYPFFIERNILLRPLGNVIYIVPPYIITDLELEYIYTTIEEFQETL